MKYGNGVEFFPSVEPDYGLLYVHARGNLSLDEMDAATTRGGKPHPRLARHQVGSDQASARRAAGEDIPEDVVGVIHYEFVDWRERKSAHEILDDLRVAMAGIPGVDVEVRVPDAGPPTGKADPGPAFGRSTRPASTTMPSRSRPPSPRCPASSTCPMVCRRPASTGRSRSTAPRRRSTASARPRSARSCNSSPTGLKLTDYRPAGADDAVDIRLRLPEDRRTLSTLDELRVADRARLGADLQLRHPQAGADGRHPQPHRRQAHHHHPGQRRHRPTRLRPCRPRSPRLVGDMDLGTGIDWKLAGSNEDSAEASAFLGKAFGAAIFLIFLVLLAQFNKFTSVLLVLSCVVMATIGVLLGMLLTGQAFVIVMSGIGVIALAGVVVNNNIVLIDTYDRLREEGWDKLDAVLQTCRERARPVVLTAVSAILGVLPIAFGLGLEIFHHETTINAPSTQWWISLSSAIVFGLSFATVLTLVVTPSMLMVFTRAAQVKPGVPSRPVQPPVPARARARPVRRPAPDLGAEPRSPSRKPPNSPLSTAECQDRAVERQGRPFALSHHIGISRREVFMTISTILIIILILVLIGAVPAWRSGRGPGAIVASGMVGVFWWCC